MLLRSFWPSLVGKWEFKHAAGSCWCPVVKVGVMDLQLTCVPSVSLKARVQNRLYDAKLKTSLLQQVKVQKGTQAGWSSSLFSKLLELGEDCHLYKNIQMARNACFCLILDAPVFFTTAAACGVLNYF